MNLRNIFFDDSARLRSGWRFLIFLFATQIIIVALLIVTNVFFSNSNVKLANDFEISLIVTNSILAFASILVGWLCGKFFERLPFRAFGISFSDAWLKNLIFGLLYGAAAMLLAALVAFAFGNVTFELNKLASPSAIRLTMGLTLLVFIIGAVAEEAFFRGYALQTFARSKLLLFGIILTSALFASGHLNNPDANVFSWINTFLAGVFFAVGYYKTRTLWFPIGLHLMWNWMQGAILGFPVSGLKQLTPAPLFHPIGDGILWITGGDYGVEAGFACTVALLVVMPLIWFAPFLKPTQEMLKLSNSEIPPTTSSSES